MSAYATIGDLGNYGVPPAALAGITSGQQQAILDAANSEADGYLAGQYVLPLSGWPRELARNVCLIAIYDLMSLRGYAPAAGADNQFERRAKDARAWLLLVSQGKVSPPGIVDSQASPHSIAGGPQIMSDTRRGWAPRPPGTSSSDGWND